MFKKTTTHLQFQRAIILLLCAGLCMPVQAERIKDIARIQGVRDNQLIGYGLIVGLDGSGDTVNQAPYTAQSFRTMLAQMGVTVPDGIKVQPKNVAAVALHATLPAFSKTGQTIDVTASSIGNSKSLRGGTLLMAPLKGADGAVYAMAQGSLVVGGVGASGGDGSSVTVNIPSVGRIPNGAIVEKTVPSPFSNGKSLTFNLREADFTTAKRLQDVINFTYGAGTASAIDAVSVNVTMPENVSDRVYFISSIENLTVSPADGAAKIVFNARTGTVVIGQHVQVGEAAVSHGALTVTISENPTVSQPQSFSKGKTTTLANTSVSIEQERKRVFLIKKQSRLQDIVNSVNRVGATPTELMAILEALKQSGALQGELVVM